MNITRNRLACLIENISTNRFGEPESLIGVICNVFGLANLSYVGVNLTGLKDGRPHVLHTYSKDWERRYWAKQHIKIDPVVNLGLNSLMPLDWRTMKTNSLSSRTFFNEANDFGVGNQGITIPIRGPRGDKGLLSFSSNEKDNLWDKYVEENLPDLNILAYHIHQSVQLAEGLGKQEIRLSKRECEVLQWLATGKSKQDVADILGISIHTVKTYAETARFRLNAMNTTHAVAIAITSSLIYPAH